MPRPQRPLRACRRLIRPAALLVLALAGCDPTAFDATVPSATIPLTVLSTPLSGNASSFNEAEPNNDFPSANALAIDQTGSAILDAALSSSQDIDVFDAGASEAGDRLVITIRTAAGLSLAIGVFDGGHDLLQFVSQTGGTGPVYFETICRAATTNLYVVVSSPSGMLMQGTYSLEIERGAGAAPDTNPQVIVLDFDGDPAVSVGGGAPVNVPPFDAARISPSFAGQTALIRQNIVEGVRAQFAGLGVAVRSTDEPGATAGAHTTVYFGTYNAELLGLADSVDSYNQDLSQSAIIFTDTFALFEVLSPSDEEIAQALANVASHEIGHLLGLWHTDDPKDLMDITASARQMLVPQTFRHAKLHSTVAPLGWQNGPDLLAWAVGGRLKMDTSNLRIMTEVNDWRADCDFQVDRRLLSVSFRK